MIPRSYLYVPGNDAAKLAKATTRGADALIVDLEDAVPGAQKERARVEVAEWLAELDPDGPQIWVRVNPGALGHTDTAAVVGPRVKGVVAAKVESVDDVTTLRQVVAEAAWDRDLDPEDIGIVPLLESAAAILAARDIAGVESVVRLQVGEADLAAEIGLTPSEDEREWGPIRAQVVLASAAAGISPPVAPVSTNFRDLDAFRASTEALARQGYVGRACIHPAQIDIVHEVFTPSAEELAHARSLLAAFEQAVAGGAGVLVGPDGRMVDEAVVRQARRVIELAR